MDNANSKPKRAKPILVAALFCEKVLEEKDTVLSAIRIIDTLVADKPPEPEADDLPWASQVMALISLRAGGAKGTHKFQLVAVTPSGKRTKMRESEITFLRPNSLVNVRATVDVPIAEAGLVWYEVRLDDRVITRMPLIIEHGLIDEEALAAEVAKNGR